MALGIDDVAVGVWTSDRVPTGCTVVLPPSGTTGAIAVRGSAPGTREAAALGPFGKVAVCHAVVLSGGSAYGLATADGVVRWLEERGIGYPVNAGAVVPIVGAAIVLDAAVAAPGARPDAAAGYAACEAATVADPPEGGVGAGTGTKVAGVAGLEHAWRGGQGIAIRRAAGVTVGAIVVNNAVGEVRGADGGWVARARVPDDAPRYPYDPRALGVGDDRGPSGNTVIGCVVTDARLDKLQAHRVADLATGGITRAIEPAHTLYDGDALFCLAANRVEATVDLVAALAVDAVAEACRRGPLAATSLRGLPPPLGDLPGLADTRT